MRIAALIALAACGSKSTTPDDAPRDSVAAVAIDATAPSDAAAPTGRVEHPVFSFVDNRHAAHRYRDGELVVDAGDIGFARYTRFMMPVAHWHLGHIVEGTRAAIADRIAALEVPLDAKMAKSIKRVVLRVNGHAKQQLAVIVNGRRPTQKAKTSRVNLVDGWQTVTLAIEPGRLGAGENELGFETTGAKGTIALAWLRLAAREGGDDTDPRTAAAFDPAANALTLAKDAMALWYVTVPEGAQLVAGVAAPCKVDVQAIASDDSFAGGALTAASPRVDLSAMAGKVVGLTITARECPTAKLVAPELRVQGAAPTAPPTGDPPRYVMLWVMDGLRADKIGGRAQTPNLDELAKSSTVFRQAYAQGNESQTSYASLFTGVYPEVRPAAGPWRIEKKLDTLAEKLAEAKVHTIGLTGNVTLTDDYARGFESWTNLSRETKTSDARVVYADAIAGAALGRLDASRDKPTFVYSGSVDMLYPWVARKPWIDAYSPTYEGPFKDYVTPNQLGYRPETASCSVVPEPPDLERLRAIYDSDIAYTDAQLGKLVAQLKKWGIWEQTMLVVTSAHGEELFEDRRCSHGGSLRDSLVRVPLVIHDPLRFPAGTLVDEGVEAIDLLPTLVAAAGAKPTDDAQGAPLSPLARGDGRGWARPSYATMADAHVMRIGRWKIRVGAPGIPVVGDMVSDPTEQLDLAKQRPVERRMLTDNLGAFLALRSQWKKAEWGVTTNVTKHGAAALDVAATP